MAYVERTWASEPMRATSSRSYPAPTDVLALQLERPAVRQVSMHQVEPYNAAVAAALAPSRTPEPGLSPPYSVPEPQMIERQKQMYAQGLDKELAEVSRLLKENTRRQKMQLQQELAEQHAKYAAHLDYLAGELRREMGAQVRQQQLHLHEAARQWKSVIAPPVPFVASDALGQALVGRMGELEHAANQANGYGQVLDTHVVQGERIIDERILRQTVRLDQAVFEQKALYDRRLDYIAREMFLKMDQLANEQYMEYLRREMQDKMHQNRADVHARLHQHLGELGNEHDMRKLWPLTSHPMQQPPLMHTPMY